MSLATITFVLLADQDRWQELGSGFRGERAQLDVFEIVVGLLLVVGAILTFWILSKLLARQDHRQAFNSPRQLFRSLCTAHQLDRAAQRLLVKLARQQDLPQPAQLFLEPQRFERAACLAFSNHQFEQLSALRRRLFADLQASG